MQLALYFDQTKCSGCYTCEVACKDWHNVPAGPARWIRVRAVEQGKYPEPFLAYMLSLCYHCAEPACVPACPVNAISKNEENGIVAVDREKCIGKDCQQCLEACPYDAPQFGAEENARMQKCDLCADRWLEGKQPICVAGCPTRALDAGPIDEMRAKHGDVRDAAGFVYNEELRPSVIFKPKPQS